MTGIRFGQNSEWQSLLNTVDGLLWSLGSITDPGEQKRLFAFVPELLRRLKAGMNYAQMPETERSAFFAELASRHLPVKPSSDSISVAPLSQPGAAQKIAAVPGEADVHLRSARELGVGGWIELGRGSGTRLYARLGWRDTSADRLFFVDEEGLNVARYTTEELASELRRKRIRLLLPDEKGQQSTPGMSA